MTKKRKAADSLIHVAGSPGAVAKATATAATVDHHEDHIPLTLDDIKASIKALCPKVPVIPEGGINEKDSEAVKEWAQVRNERSFFFELIPRIIVLSNLNLE